MAPCSARGLTNQVCDGSGVGVRSVQDVGRCEPGAWRMFDEESRHCLEPDAEPWPLRMHRLLLPAFNRLGDVQLVIALHPSPTARPCSSRHRGRYRPKPIAWCPTSWRKTTQLMGPRG